MAPYIKVTPDAVRAARIRVQALQSAGLEPDPTVVKIANAPRLSGNWVKEQIQREQPTEADERRSATRAEARERAIADNRRLWDSVRAPDVSTSRARMVQSLRAAHGSH